MPVLALRICKNSVARGMLDLDGQVQVGMGHGLGKFQSFGWDYIPKLNKCPKKIPSCASQSVKNWDLDPIIIRNQAVAGANRVVTVAVSGFWVESKIFPRNPGRSLRTLARSRDDTALGRRHLIRYSRNRRERPALPCVPAARRSCRVRMHRSRNSRSGLNWSLHPNRYWSIFFGVQSVACRFAREFDRKAPLSGDFATLSLHTSYRETCAGTYSEGLARVQRYDGARQSVKQVLSSHYPT